MLKVRIQFERIAEIEIDMVNDSTGKVTLIPKGGYILSKGGMPTDKYFQFEQDELEQALLKVNDILQPKIPFKLTKQ